MLVKLAGVAWTWVRDPALLRLALSPMAASITASMFHRRDLGADLLLDSGAVIQRVLDAVDCHATAFAGRVDRNDIRDPKV